MACEPHPALEPHGTRLGGEVSSEQVDRLEKLKASPPSRPPLTLESHEICSIMKNFRSKYKQVLHSRMLRWSDTVQSLRQNGSGTGGSRGRRVTGHGGQRNVAS
jgi:hypothetical protein